MSSAQAIASSRFLTAMGPMIEDEQKMSEVLEFIERIKIQPIYPRITQEELDKNSMPLHEAMDKLREKARAFYQA